MSLSRKRHVRERLRNVENTLNILNGLGVHMKALVGRAAWCKACLQMH